MGTTPSMLTKEILFVTNDPPQYQGGQALGFNMAMGSPGVSSDDDIYENTRLRCSGVNAICESKKFVNGEPTNEWEWKEASRTGVFDNPVCQHAFDTFGDPCTLRGRGLPTPPGGPTSRGTNPLDIKSWKTKDWVLAGSLAVILVGSVTLLMTAKKS